MRILIAEYFEKSGREKWNERAEKLGIKIDYVTWNELLSNTSEGDPLTFNGKILREFDVVYIRTIREKYYAMVQLVTEARRLGIPVVDRSLTYGNRVSDGKAYQMVYLASKGLPVPKTVVAEKEVIHKNLDQFSKMPVILKMTSKHRGFGVHLVSKKNEIKKIVAKNKDEKNFYLQEKINYVSDYRIIVIGGEVLGAIKRIPQKGEFRANVSRGGEAERITSLPGKLKRLAVKASDLFEYDFAGVDILVDNRRNPYILEVNRAPQFKGFQRATGIDVRMEILKFLKKVATKRKRRFRLSF